MSEFWICQQSFPKYLRLTLWFSCEIADYVKNSRILNVFLVLDVARVLDITGFWICFRFWIWQGYTEFRICLNSSWVCQNVADYVWICLNIPEYAGICVNMPKSAWMTFVLYYPIYSFVLQSPFYLNTWLLIWTSTGD